MVLTLIIAESALELVPEDIAGHPSVVASAKRRRRRPNEVILDRSYHHFAMKLMKPLKDGEIPNVKRGRPDIIHVTLLEALGTPLNREGLLRTYVHTVDDHVLRLNPKVRIPRNYDRFVGLLEQLYKIGRVPPEGSPLIVLDKRTLSSLVAELQPTYIIGFSTLGSPTRLSTVCARLAREESPAAIVGGFPHSHFLDDTVRLCNELVRIDKEGLDTWVVVGRIVYEFERGIGLDELRL